MRDKKITSIITKAKNSEQKEKQTKQRKTNTLTAREDPQPDHVRDKKITKAKKLRATRKTKRTNKKIKYEQRQGNVNQSVMCVKTYFARLVLLSLVTTSSWRMFLTWSTSQHVARERYLVCVIKLFFVQIPSYIHTFMFTEQKTVYCRFALLAATFSKDTSGED